MPKKSKRSRRQYNGPASVGTPAMDVSQKSSVPRPVRTAVGSRQSAVVAISPEKYSYVSRELKYISVITGSMFLVLMVLYFFFR
jgi:hypothetical protein